MAPISPTKAGLAFGVVLGAWHFLWALLVAFHLAQPLIDFVFWMHFLKPMLVVEEFSPGRALILVATTTAVGFVFGACLAFLWNQFHKPIRPRDFS